MAGIMALQLARAKEEGNFEHLYGNENGNWWILLDKELILILNIRSRLCPVTESKIGADW